MRSRSARREFNAGRQVIPLMQPRLAQLLTQAIKALNKLGIVPTITDGFRTPQMQQAIRRGSQPYRVATGVSGHQVGLSADLGPKSNAGHNEQINEEMTAAGLRNGADFPKPDPLHYFPAGTRQEQNDTRMRSCLDTLRRLNADAKHR